MFCNKCGYPNPDDSAFCLKCGSAFPPVQSMPPQTNHPQPVQAAPQQAAYAPPPQSYTPQSAPQQPYYAPPPVKKNKGLVIGLLCGCGVLLVAVIVLAVLLLTGSPTQGQWYNEALASVMELDNNGKLTYTTPDGEATADYTYDKETGKGTISGDITGDGTELYFILLDDQMVLYDADTDQPYSWFYKSEVVIDADDFVRYPHYEYHDDDNTSGILGTWYAADGYSGTVVIRADGTFTASALGQSYSGVYTYNSGSGTFSYPDYDVSVPFTYSANQISCGGAVYTHNYVYQMTMEEFIDEYGDVSSYGLPAG